MSRLHHDPTDELNLVIVSHGLAIHVFLMKLFKWTVKRFELLNNLGNCEFQVMQLGDGGEYSLAVQHNEEQIREWGLSPDMIADQQWRAQANKGNWTDSCSWYPNSFFDKFADPETEGTGDELQSPPYFDCSNDS